MQVIFVKNIKNVGKNPTVSDGEVAYIIKSSP